MERRVLSISLTPELPRLALIEAQGDGIVGEVVRAGPHWRRQREARRRDRIRHGSQAPGQHARA